MIHDRPCHCNHSKVEMDPYCRSVLLARQRDQCLPLCSISEDVREYSPKWAHQEAELVAAGFPCQASCFKLQVMRLCTYHCFLEFKVDLPLLQGTSVAGAQRGLEDSRSSLVKEPFRVYDELEKPFFTQRHWLYKRLTNFLMSCHHSSWRFLRKALLLENVAGLLSSNSETRKLFLYILKANCCRSFSFLGSKSLFCRNVQSETCVWAGAACLWRTLDCRPWPQPWIPVIALQSIGFRLGESESSSSARSQTLLSRSCRVCFLNSNLFLL